MSCWDSTLTHSPENEYSLCYGFWFDAGLSPACLPHAVSVSSAPACRLVSDWRSCHSFVAGGHCEQHNRRCLEANVSSALIYWFTIDFVELLIWRLFLCAATPRKLRCCACPCRLWCTRLSIWRIQWRLLYQFCLTMWARASLRQASVVESVVVCCRQVSSCSLQLTVKAAGGSGQYKFEADIFSEKTVFSVGDLSGLVTVASSGKRDLWVTDVKSSFNGVCGPHHAVLHLPALTCELVQVLHSVYLLLLLQVCHLFLGLLRWKKERTLF